MERPGRCEEVKGTEMEKSKVGKGRREGVMRSVRRRGWGKEGRKAEVKGRLLKWRCKKRGWRGWCENVKGSRSGDVEKGIRQRCGRD